MIGRLRNLRPLWSGNGRLADEAIAIADRAIERGEAAVDRIAELVLENEELATELSVERQHSDELESEIAALSRELIAVAHRSAELRRMVEASPEQVRKNCLALSDRNAELRRDLNDLTKRCAELERGAAVFGVVSP